MEKLEKLIQSNNEVNNKIEQTVCYPCRRLRSPELIPGKLLQIGLKVSVIREEVVTN